MKERATFNLLWDLVNLCEGEATNNQGSIVSRYAGMIDDRIENSGNSRSVDSLKLYTTEQLQDEIDSREVKE